MVKRASLAGSDELFRDTRRPHLSQVIPVLAEEEQEEAPDASARPLTLPGRRQVAVLRLDRGELALLLKAIQHAKFPGGQSPKLPLSEYEQFDALRLKVLEAAREAFGEP
jgi:hypothetical protein